MTVQAYGQTFKFDSRDTCGYIKCDKRKKVYPISKDVVPYKAKKGDSFLCIGCGKYTDETIFYHTLFWNGEIITYGY